MPTIGSSLPCVKRIGNTSRTRSKALTILAMAREFSAPNNNDIVVFCMKFCYRFVSVCLRLNTLANSPKLGFAAHHIRVKVNNGPEGIPQRDHAFDYLHPISVDIFSRIIQSLWESSMMGLSLTKLLKFNT